MTNLPPRVWWSPSMRNRYDLGDVYGLIVEDEGEPTVSDPYGVWSALDGLPPDAFLLAPTEDPEGAEEEVVTRRDAPEGRGPGTPAGGAG